MGKVKCPVWGCNGVGVPVDTKKEIFVRKGYRRKYCWWTDQSGRGNSRNNDGC